MCVSFDSDPTKASSNFTKHNVTFSEAYESIHDPNAIWLFDTEHSDDEDRFVSIGLSHSGKLLFTVYTMREEVYEHSKKALLAGKHVLCESPIAYTREQCQELYALAKENNLILMDAIKTAYSTAYERLLLMAKGGKIGKVVSIDAVCTSLRDGISIEGNRSFKEME